MSVQAVAKSAIHLAVQEYPALGATVITEPLVLLHGWGCDSRTWKPLLPQLQQFARVITIDLPGFGESETLPDFILEHVLTALAQAIPTRAILLGWSLGGMLAVILAARYPQKITQIITLAANAKFVANDDYSTAMPIAINQDFTQSFAVDAPLTLKRFSGLLVQGDANERGLLKALRAENTRAVINHNWLQALELLACLDNRADFAQLSQPGLHLLGDVDALVPVAAVNALQQLNSQQTVIVLSETAHAMHWSQTAKVADAIRFFLQPAALDKRKVANSFSRAANTYDSVAGLQRDVGACLLQVLAAQNIQTSSIARVLDLGCGTGFFSEFLAQHFSAADVIGLDIAEGMLAFARTARPQAIAWLCGDAESLPLQTGSMDVVFSSLAIQWCDNLPKLFAELRRVLAPEGRLVFSTLGPATLHELKSAWQQVDGYVHVNRFCSAAQLQTALQVAGFQVDHWQSEYRTLHYDRLVDLTRELKALGAHNINRGQQGGLTGRRKLDALKQAYEVFRCEQHLPATYEVFYGSVSLSSCIVGE